MRPQATTCVRNVVASKYIDDKNPVGNIVRAHVIGSDLNISVILMTGQERDTPRATCGILPWKMMTRPGLGYAMSVVSDKSEVKNTVSPPQSGFHTGCG